MESSQQAEVVSKNIWLIGSPIVFAFGFVGNILIIIIYLRNKKTSSTIYLMYLATTDLLELCALIPRWWIIYMFGVDIRHIHGSVCQLVIFLLMFSGRASNICLVFITMERVIATVIARPIYTLCTPKLAYSLLFAMTICLAVLYTHTFFGFKVIETRIALLSQSTVARPNDTLSTSTTPHKVSDMYSDMYDSSFAGMAIWNASSSTESVLDNLKLTTIFSTSVLPMSTDQQFVTVKSCAPRPEFVDYTNAMDGISTYGFVFGTNLLLFIGTIIIIRKLTIVKSTLKYAINQGSTAPNKETSTSRKRTSQTTITVLVVNVFLFVFHTPLYVFYILRSTFVDPVKGMTANQNLAWSILFMMHNINYAINFYLYLMMGSKFRQQCKELFMCIKPGQYSSKKSMSM